MELNRGNTNLRRSHLYTSIEQIAKGRVVEGTSITDCGVMRKKVNKTGSTIIKYLERMMAKEDKSSI